MRVRVGCGFLAQHGCIRFAERWRRYLAAALQRGAAGRAQLERQSRRRNHDIRSELELRIEPALAQLNMEYELEASAMLALRQSMDAYRKVRPMAEC